MSVHVMHLERMRRMSAPGALAISLHHRMLWDLRPFPFDEATWEVLGHRCPDPGCRRSQGWHHTRGLDRCDECGGPLAGAAGELVPENERDALSAALATFHADPARRAAATGSLPLCLRDAERGEVLDLLVSLAVVVDPSLRALHNPWSLRLGAPPLTVIRAIARAWPMLAGWPEAFEAFALARAMGTRRGRGDGNGGATARLLRIPDMPAAPDGLARIVAEERRRLETAGEERGVKASAASGYRGLRSSDISKARRDGRLGVIASVRRGLFIPLLVRSEVEEMSRRFVEGLPLLKAGALIGCGRLGVEQLSAMGLLDADGPDLPITGHEPRVSASALTSLERRLHERSANLGKEAVAVSKAFSSFGGSPKSVGPLIAAILVGNVPGHLAAGNRPLLHRLSIPRSALPALRAMRFDRDRHAGHPFVTLVSKQEAGRELNLSSVKWVELLARWPTDGKLPVIPVPWLLQTMAERISVKEIAARMARSGRFARFRLKAQGIVEREPFLYERREVEAAFGTWSAEAYRPIS